jgi:hypothetical protein
MKKRRFTDQQIAQALRQAEHGTAVAELCRSRGDFVAESTNAGNVSPSHIVSNRWRSGRPREAICIRSPSCLPRTVPTVIDPTQRPRWVVRRAV